MAPSTDQFQVGLRNSQPLCRIRIQEPRVALTAINPRQRWRVPQVASIPSSRKFEYVRPNIIPPQIRQPPVQLYTAQYTIVRVKCIVFRPAQRLGHGIAQKQAGNLVRLRVVLALVVREVDKGPAVGEGAVGEQGLEEGVRPRGRIREGRVVAVVEHVGRHEDELGHLGRGEVVGEGVEGADGPEARAVQEDRAEGDEGAVGREGTVLAVEPSWRIGWLVGRASLLVFPHVVPHARFAAPFACHAQVSRPGQILKISAPTDALCLQQIYHRRHVLGYPDAIVMVKAEVVPTDRSEIVGLGGMRVRVVFR